VRNGRHTQTIHQCRMGHFSFSYSSSSDSEHENAVEELLSQFLDEDLLKITTNPVGSRGSARHGLDPELEKRYEKLKASVSNLRPPGPPQSLEGRHSRLSESAEAQLPGNNPTSSAGSPRDSDSNSNPISEGRSTSAATSPRGNSNSRPPKKTSRTLMASSPSVRSQRSCSLSPSPPRSCFCGSPKKLLRSLSSKRSSGSSKMKKSDSHIGDDELTAAVVSEKSKMRVRNKDRGRPKDELDSLSDDEFLTDLSTFSLKGQRKQLKKALKEEQKVNRDAEDLVKWVKQASARMDDRVLDDLLSDEEEFK